MVKSSTMLAGAQCGSASTMQQQKQYMAKAPPSLRLLLLQELGHHRLDLGGGDVARDDRADRSSLDLLHW